MEKAPAQAAVGGVAAVMGVSPERLVPWHLPGGGAAMRLLPEAAEPSAVADGAELTQARARASSRRRASCDPSIQMFLEQRRTGAITALHTYSGFPDMCRPRNPVPHASPPTPQLNRDMRHHAVIPLLLLPFGARGNA